MENQKNNVGIGMSVFGAIFFIFGFATTFIVQLSAPVMAVFDLSEFQAQLLTSAFFIAYPIMSMPTGILINKIGYKKTVIAGLFLMAIGSLIFIPASKIPSFSLFLLATFVLAVGVVFLQVSANPYVTALGSESSASSRLNLTQALNSIATMVAPWLIAVLVFKGLSQATLSAEEYGLEVAQRIPTPFIAMASIVILVALVLMRIKVPSIEVENEEKTSWTSIFKYPHVVLGALGIFFYVGAEVGNAGLMTNYLRESQGFTSEEAITYAALYWGGAMVGRFFGSIMFSTLEEGIKKYSYIALVVVLAFVSAYLLTDKDATSGLIFAGIAVLNFIFMKIGSGQPAKTLGFFAIIAASLAIISTLTSGPISLWTVVSIGLFNSIMFPNIFTLAVRNLKGGELGAASGLINSLIVGGAIIPPLMGFIAEKQGYNIAYIIPAICYLYIFFFAVKGRKVGLKNN